MTKILQFVFALCLQVLQIDVLAHKSTVETVNKAGNDLVESSAGEEASGLQSKLENLNQRWKTILEKTEQRKQQLKSALHQVKKNNLGVNNIFYCFFKLLV